MSLIWWTFRSNYFYFQSNFRSDSYIWYGYKIIIQIVVNWMDLQVVDSRNKFQTLTQLLNYVWIMYGKRTNSRFINKFGGSFFKNAIKIESNLHAINSIKRESVSNCIPLSIEEAMWTRKVRSENRMALTRLKSGWQLIWVRNSKKKNY